MKKRLICVCDTVVLLKKLYSVLLIVSLIVLSSLVTYSAEAAGIPKKAISSSDQWSTTDLPKGTMDNGFLKASIGNTPSYSTISASDVPDLSSTYAKLNGGRVPNSLLPDAVVRANQTNTFGAFAQLFKALYFEIVDGTDPTKIMAFDNSGMTTGKTLTIKPLSTTTQTLQIPNISTTDTLTTLGLTQTFTGNPVTIDNLKLGANNADANAKKITNLAAATVSTDAVRADQLGIIGSIPTTACLAGQVLKYSGTAWTCNYDEHHYNFLSGGIAAGVGSAWTNMPVALTEFYNSASRRIDVDTSDYNEFRLQAGYTAVGATNAFIGLQFSSDGGATWKAPNNGTAGDISTPNITIGSTAPASKFTSWTSLDSTAKGDFLWRIAGARGDATADPAFTNVFVEFR